MQIKRSFLALMLVLILFSCSKVQGPDFLLILADDMGEGYQAYLNDECVTIPELPEQPPPDWESLSGSARENSTVNRIDRQILIN